LATVQRYADLAPEHLHDVVERLVRLSLLRRMELRCNFDASGSNYLRCIVTT